MTTPAEQAPRLPAPMLRSALLTLPLWGSVLLVWLCNAAGLLGSAIGVGLLILGAAALPLPAIRMIWRALAHKRTAGYTAVVLYYLASWFAMVVLAFMTAAFIGLSYSR